MPNIYTVHSNQGIRIGDSYREYSRDCKEVSHSDGP